MFNISNRGHHLSYWSRTIEPLVQVLAAGKIYDVSFTSIGLKRTQDINFAPIGRKDTFEIHLINAVRF